MSFAVFVGDDVDSVEERRVEMGDFVERDFFRPAASAAVTALETSRGPRLALSASV